MDSHLFDFCDWRFGISHFHDSTPFSALNSDPKTISLRTIVAASAR
jgi:hypothetical protein